VIGFLIVHFQIPYQSIFGIEPVKGNYIWVNPLVVNYATEVSGVTLLLWYIGNYIFYLNPSKFKQPATVSRLYHIKTGWLFNISIISSLILFCITVGSSFWSGSHAGVYNWGPGATYSFLVFRSLLTLAVIYMFLNNRGRFVSLNSAVNVFYRNKVLFFLIIFYCLLFLFIGDRGPVLQLGLVFFGCYTLFNVNLSFSRLVVIVVSAAFLLTVIGLGRTSDANLKEGNVFTRGFEKLSNTDETLLPTEELASSVRILYRALNVVPNEHPYLNGLTIGANLIDLIPFSSRLVDIPPIYQSSTSFFTIYEKGEDFEFGDGSEIIADLYINFGIEIAYVVFLLFGYFVAWLTFNAKINRSHVVIIVYLGFIALSLYLNRSNFLFPVKYILYLIIFDRLFSKKIYYNE